MAGIKLPTYTDLGPTPVPEAPTSIATYDPSKAFVAQEQEGDTIAKAAGDFQDLYDKTAVNDTYANTFAPQARDIEMKYRALQGKDAVDQFPDYQQQIIDLQNQTKESLTGRQQELFNSIATAHTERALDTMGSYQDQQTKVYAEKTNTSTLDNFVTDAAAHYDDPNYLKQNLMSGFHQIEGYGASTGQSPDMIQQQKVAYASKIYTDVYKSKAAFDPEGALSDFKANMDKIKDPAALQQTSEQLASAVQPGRADGTTTTIMGGNPTVNFPALSAAITSDGEHGKVGDVSSKGALGPMQVIPSTAMAVAKELGLPYDPDKLQNDPAYNKAIGDRYLQDMCEQYNGNQTLAVAAYNAGPTQTDAWIKQFGDPRTGAISDADFAAKIPFKETRDYISRVNAACPPVAGTPPTSSDPTDHVKEWLAQAGQMPDGDVKEMTLAGLQTKTNQITQAQDQADLNNRSTLLTGLTQGKITTPADLQDPAMQQAWMNAAPAIQQHVLQAMYYQGSNKNLTAEGFRSYNELMGQAATDPTGFSKVDLNGYYGKIPNAQLEKLSDLQKATMQSQTKQLEQTVPYARLKEIADPLVRGQLNIDPDNKKKTADQATYNNFIGRLSQDVEDFKTQQKKIPADGDIQKMAVNLLTPVAQDKINWFGHHSMDSTPAFKIQPNDVPDADKALIIPAYQKQFGRPPTDQDMLRMYLAKKQGG